MVDVIRGFTCKVAKAELSHGQSRTGIGVSHKDGELRIAITHPEFGTLVAFVTDDLCGKLADLLGAPAEETLQ